MMNTDFAKRTSDAEFHLPKREMADLTAASVVQPPLYPSPALPEIAGKRGRPTAELQREAPLTVIL